jgi:hypothetical protein
MDHNSMIYYKHFWDAAAPLVFNLGLKSLQSSEKRFQYALDTIKLDLSSETTFKFEQITDFTYKPSQIYESTSFFHVIDDKSTSRKDHIIEFPIDHSKPLLIETNLDKQRKLRIIMVDESNNAQEAIYNDKHVRVHHKSNLMVVRINEIQGRFKKIVLISEYGYKGEADKTLMNLSPTFDKKHPTILKQKAEPRVYIKVS